MEYQPLNTDSKEIRLITILPETGSDGIRCTLQHVSLINPPVYVALSYCWGKLTETREIELNGCNFRVTTNLYEALVHLREKRYSRMWVDFISINQMDKDERNQQVLLMGTIYKRAEEVAVWVGVEDPAADLAILLLEAMTETKLSPSVNNTKYWRGLTQFLERPYWSRVWIIQEVAVASDIKIHCGKKEINWDRLLTAIHAATSNENEGSDELYKTLAYKNLRGLSKFYSDAAERKPIHFLDALNRSFRAQSTDPRDKAFALLGLVFDGTAYISVPNYKQTVEEICFETTIAAIKSASSLDIVPFLGRGCDDLTGPSWIVDWLQFGGPDAAFPVGYLTNTINYNSHDRKVAPFRIAFLTGYLEVSLQYKSYRRNDASEGASINGSSRYSAAGNSMPRISFQNDVLITQGIILDIISGVTQTLSEAQNFEVIPQSKNSSKSMANPYGSRRNAFHQIVSTFILRYAPWKDEPARYRKIHAQWFMSMWNPSYNSGLSLPVRTWLEKNQGFLIHGISLREWAKQMRFSFTTPLDVVSKNISRFELSLLRHILSSSVLKSLFVQDIEDAMSYGRRLMTTEQGYVGWAHRRAQPGDLVCLLSGCGVPVILRERPAGGYHLVGDAFILSVMKGEKAKKEDRDQWVDMEIF